MIVPVRQFLSFLVAFHIIPVCLVVSLGRYEKTKTQTVYTQTVYTQTMYTQTALALPNWPLWKSCRPKLDAWQKLKASSAYHSILFGFDMMYAYNIDSNALSAHLRRNINLSIPNARSACHRSLICSTVFFIVIIMLNMCSFPLLIVFCNAM